MVAALATTVAGAPGADAATVLYDNGSINGTVFAWNITSSYAVEDSFTVASDTVATGVNFGAWLDQGATAVALDWGITTDPTSFAAPNAASIMTNAVCPDCGFDAYDIAWDSFSLGQVALIAGTTYYLVLTDATATDGGGVYWDENDGPSIAFQTNSGRLPGSEAFQIVGAPEPSSWAMIGLGFAGVGFARFCGRKNVAIAA